MDVFAIKSLMMLVIIILYINIFIVDNWYIT